VLQAVASKTRQALRRIIFIVATLAMADFAGYIIQGKQISEWRPSGERFLILFQSKGKSQLRLLRSLQTRVRGKRILHLNELALLLPSPIDPS
jgi:hypothetical protein